MRFQLTTTKIGNVNKVGQLGRICEYTTIHTLMETKGGDFFFLAGGDASLV